MARIEFSLDYYKSLPDCKVETGRGEKVSIVKTDMKNDFPILAVIQDFPNHEDYDSYTLDGKNELSVDDPYNDLFIVTDEPEELTEFEEKVKSCMFDSREIRAIVDEDVKEWAEILLSLAREQLIHEGYIIEKKAFHDAVGKVEPEVMKEVEENVDAEKEFETVFEAYWNQNYGSFRHGPTTEECAKYFYAFGKTEGLKKYITNDDIKTMLCMEYEKGRADMLKELPRWKRCHDTRTGLYRTTTFDMRLNKDGYWLSLDELWNKLLKEE